MNNLSLQRRARFIARENAGLIAALVIAAALAGILYVISPQIWDLANPIWETAKAPKQLDIERIDWTGIGALAAILTFSVNLILVVSVWHGFSSVKEGQATRSADVLSWASQQMDNVKADERIVRSAPNDFRLWDDTVRQSANRVCNAYQRLCYFARNGLIERRHFRNMWGVNICIHWAMLEPYIVSERERFGDRASGYDGAYLRSDFEILAKSFTRYFNRKLPNLLEGYRQNASALRSPGNDLNAALAAFRSANPEVPPADVYEHILRQALQARGHLQADQATARPE